MDNLLTQIIVIPGVTGTIQGPLPSGRFTNLASLVNNAMPILMALAGIALLLYLIWGGFDFLTSMGDPKKAEAGKTKITQAIIGFFIIFAAYWITQLVAFLFGLQGRAGF
ncbi:hypothetical protein A3D78_03740 [Candidatus Gottesmanbacteria bacterium RIFCSPHIGHO2_02_FULL_39_14]|uniref:Uncharacterized protein n=2 Tax=Candidatus Gottesmaniibacteriota TaxID=1752720 RepID=A0A1F5ZYB5_9BACT|nr:MAG: hypothetical protein A2153_02445 [Candidatus Gottesmanbacteria bacterium RBG_16_38_7b]OGG17152.1 MAG: hypothetical protein A3D78_03740 [Candidatus Gottesmanbacteria bacterium RIFCSPHIGHO2_02_FULL_39_14]